MTTKVNAINPSHYTNRSVQCIEFTRFMDFSLGNAFKYAWRLGMKDDESQEMGKVHWYVRDAIAYEPAKLHPEMYKLLKRRLTLMADEFPEKTWVLLSALLAAASGDYTMLTTYAKAANILKPMAHEIMFGEPQNEEDKER